MEYGQNQAETDAIRDTASHFKLCIFTKIMILLIMYYKLYCILFNT